MIEIRLVLDYIYQKFYFFIFFDKWFYFSICFMMRLFVFGMIGMFQWNVFVFFFNDQFFYIVKVIFMIVGVIVRIIVRYGNKYDGSYCE